jgi:acyl carrier protein
MSCQITRIRVGARNFFIGRAAEFGCGPSSARLSKIEMQQIDERFLSFSPETLAAIRAYRQNHDSKLVQTIVQGIVEKYLPPEIRDRAPEAMKALNAFGIESVTLMEIILDIQDALEIVITDAELRSLRNFDDATKLLREKVAALSEGGQSRT